METVGGEILEKELPKEDSKDPRLKDLVGSNPGLEFRLWGLGFRV